MQAASHDTAPPLEYESLTDTIKRRLESPVDTPHTEKPEIKKSKIPLALKSPVPIKKEIKEGGIRSRGSSLERGKRKSRSPTSDSIGSAMSADSMEAGARARAGGSAPSTPSTPNKESSTFNLLQDSDLFTQISKNKLHAEPEPEPARRAERQKTDPCHVVEIKEHEIVKSTVTPIEPMEMYPFETIDAVVEFIPQNAETVHIIDDTDMESIELRSDDDDKRPSVDLGSEPKTFMIEVKTLEARRKPTLGILKRKSEEDERPKSLRVTMEVPDLIPADEERDVSMKTPPPTPAAADEAGECPLLYDLAVRQQEAERSLRRDQVNEYLILDEVPKDQAALPEPSVTEEVADQLAGAGKQQAAEAGAAQGEEEVIYSEVEDMPQVIS